MGPASETATVLGQAIDVVMNALIPISSQNESIRWTLHASISSPSDPESEPPQPRGTSSSQSCIAQEITFEVESDGKRWKSQEDRLDAALSLWMYHIHQRTSQPVHAAQDGDMRKPELNFEDISTHINKEVTQLTWVCGPTTQLDRNHKVCRILGLYSTTLKRDIQWWIGDAVKCEEMFLSDRLRDLSLLGFSNSHLGGLIGTHVKGGNHIEHRTHYVTIADGRLVNLLAQHIFMCFMWDISHKPQRPTAVLSNYTTSISRTDAFRIRDPSSLSSLRMENNILLQTATGVQQTGLTSTLDEAYLCIIPALSSTGLPFGDVIDLVWQQSKENECLFRYKTYIPILLRLYSEIRGISADFFKLTAIMLHVYNSIRRRRAYLELMPQIGSTLPFEVGETYEQVVGEAIVGRCHQHISRALEYGHESPSRAQRLPCPWLIWLLSSRISPSLLTAKECLNDFSCRHWGLNHHCASHHSTPRRDQQTMNLYSPPFLDTNMEFVVPDSFQYTLLHYAVMSNSPQAVRALLDRGANPNALDVAEMTPLHYAVGDLAFEFKYCFDDIAD
ncbi:hypothetical protein EX30DRAFT_121609 [Ascodesmis nigricans]|uniref:Uncharacterized protein n=1 Tax=Ascodesmis nigricans TaxID=341454 RepID=A0A4S2MPE0_9PEZI|nr:hypothetical protein EX30DRAFT_121609 [Ascodesmis nigricans]